MRLWGLVGVSSWIGLRLTVLSEAFVGASYMPGKSCLDLCRQLVFGSLCGRVLGLWRVPYLPCVIAQATVW